MGELEVERKSGHCMLRYRRRNTYHPALTRRSNVSMSSRHSVAIVNLEPTNLRTPDNALVLPRQLFLNLSKLRMISLKCVDSLLSKLSSGYVLLKQLILSSGWQSGQIWLTRSSSAKDKPVGSGSLK